MAEHERKAAEERQRTGRRIAGRKAILRQSPYSCPQRRGLRPRVATRNKWRRIEALQRLKQWYREYRAALLAWRDGDRAVVFPFGTYGLRVRQGVACAPAPS